MTDPLDRLAYAKSKADSLANLERFIADRRADGWSDIDIADYEESICALMGDSDSIALRLFPLGTYKTADIARKDACEYWALRRN
jgi:hypothetical protein